MSDNSFLTHLATGRLIWDVGIPREDPYTFTAAGLEWAAQSWFASVVYGGAEKLGGLAAVRLQFALTAAVLAALGWMLTRGAIDLLRRMLAVAPFLALASLGWTHRPYVIGLLCLALVLLACEGRLDPRWLVAVGWLWLNTHGGWPLGLLAAAALWAGRRLDGERGRAEGRAFAWLALGLLVGGVNPYGLRLLSFPFVALERRDAFSNIVEWQAPTFVHGDELVFLLALAAAIVALRRRPTWHRAVPLVVFTLAALVSARNVQVAALITLPGVAEGFRRERATGPSDGFANLRLPIAAAAGALVLVATLALATEGDFDDDPYPVAATDFLEERNLGPTTVRVVAPDFVGNYWEARYGTAARTFFDDRVELFPLPLFEDYEALIGGQPGWDDVLDRYRSDVVLWNRQLPLAELLRLDDRWTFEYEDDSWVVARRR